MQLGLGMTIPGLEDSGNLCILLHMKVLQERKMPRYQPAEIEA